MIKHLNDDASVDVACVQCSQPIPRTVRQLGTDDTFTCPHCDALYDARDFRSKLEQMDHQIGQFFERRLVRRTANEVTRVIRCSFCSIPKGEGSKFISGPSDPHPVYICPACVELCVEVLEGDGVKFKWSA